MEDSDGKDEKVIAIKSKRRWHSMLFLSEQGLENSNRATTVPPG